MADEKKEETKPCREVLSFGRGDAKMFFACGGAEGHPGYHIMSGTDLQGKRYLMIWGDGRSTIRPSGD